MGVRVTAALTAAIVQIIARVGLSPGINTATALPTQAPVKNRGILTLSGLKPRRFYTLRRNLLNQACAKKSSGSDSCSVTSGLSIPSDAAIQNIYCCVHISL